MQQGGSRDLESTFRSVSFFLGWSLETESRWGSWVCKWSAAMCLSCVCFDARDALERVLLNIQPSTKPNRSFMTQVECLLMKLGCIEFSKSKSHSSNSVRSDHPPSLNPIKQFSISSLYIRDSIWSRVCIFSAFNLPILLQHQTRVKTGLMWTSQLTYHGGKRLSSSWIWLLTLQLCFSFSNNGYG